MRDQSGIVMVAVLWICALIMWLALQIGAETRLQSEEKVHQLRRSQALYLAIGGAYEALARMGQPISLETEDDEQLTWQPDGTLHEVNYRTGKALVVIQKETDKVNVNEANPLQIKAVLEKRGIEDEDADTLADVIADFLDADETPRLHGAEKDWYAKEELPNVPFDGPLTSIDQMLLIPGITQQLFYGFNLGEEQPESDIVQDEFQLFATKDSLFQMFTVHGKNVSLEDEEILEEADVRYVTWEPDGIYRILSCGKSSTGPPPVVLWLVIRYAPESEKGYEVLYRKVL